MLVTCDYCLTEYEVEPGPGGRVKFRCQTCGRKVVGSSLRESDAPIERPAISPVVVPPPVVAEPPPPSPEPEPAAPEEPAVPSVALSEQLLLKQQGEVSTLADMAEAQRGIVEGQIFREDLLSADGLRWEPVGEHPELKLFFNLVARLDALKENLPSAYPPPPLDPTALHSPKKLQPAPDPNRSQWAARAEEWGVDLDPDTSEVERQSALRFAPLPQIHLPETEAPIELEMSEAPADLEDDSEDLNMSEEEVEDHPSGPAAIQLALSDRVPIGVAVLPSIEEALERPTELAPSPEAASSPEDINARFPEIPEVQDPTDAPDPNHVSTTPYLLKNQLSDAPPELAPEGESVPESEPLEADAAEESAPESEPAPPMSAPSLEVAYVPPSLEAEEIAPTVIQEPPLAKEPELAPERDLEPAPTEEAPRPEPEPEPQDKELDSLGFDDDVISERFFASPTAATPNLVVQSARREQPLPPPTLIKREESAQWIWLVGVAAFLVVIGGYWLSKPDPLPPREETPKPAYPVLEPANQAPPTPDPAEPPKPPEPAKPAEAAAAEPAKPVEPEKPAEPPKPVAEAAPPVVPAPAPQPAPAPAPAAGGAAQLYTQQGWAAISQKNWNVARVQFVEAVALAPNDKDANYGLGYAAHQQGDITTATKHYCRALASAGGDVELSREIGGLLQTIGGACQ